MAFIQWDHKLSLGNQRIDEHHQHLIDLINKLYDHFTVPGSEKLGIETVVHELIDYAMYHFAAEEDLMKKHGYPAIADHVREHREFRERVVEYDKRLSGSRKLITAEVLVFLRDWLISHIKEIDGQLGRFLKGEGVS